MDGIEVEYLGRVAERDTRLLTVQVLKGALAGHTEEQVNDVNAPGLAEERGISVAETKNTTARDFSDLLRVTVVSGGGERTRVVGTVLGRRDRPHLLEAWGSRFNVQLEDHLAIFRYEDRPGMLGRIGTAFGERGVNIRSAAVGMGKEDDGQAVMLVVSDAVPQELVDELVAERRLRGRPRGQPVSPTASSASAWSKYRCSRMILPLPVEGGENSHLLGDGRAAGLAHRGHLHENEEAVPEVDQLARLVAQLGPVAEPVALELAVAIVALVSLRETRARRHRSTSSAARF